MSRHQRRNRANRRKFGRLIEPRVVKEENMPERQGMDALGSYGNPEDPICKWAARGMVCDCLQCMQAYGDSK
jgi:hypothetical protein